MVKTSLMDLVNSVKGKMTKSKSKKISELVKGEIFLDELKRIESNEEELVYLELTNEIADYKKYGSFEFTDIADLFDDVISERTNILKHEKELKLLRSMYSDFIASCGLVASNKDIASAIDQFDTVTFNFDQSVKKNTGALTLFLFNEKDVPDFPAEDLANKIVSSLKNAKIQQAKTQTTIINVLP